MEKSIVLSVENVTKSIGTKTIIQEASFEVESGKITGLLGPNGAGKTTIIRMLVGLMRHDQGNIRIMNYSISKDFTQAMEHVGAIVENPEFYNYMTGMENLKQYARMAKKDISENYLNEVIKSVHMENHIDQKVKTYSLGMRQRLGVAQAIIHTPDLLILDEPMNGLDPKGMREFRDMLATLKQQGVGILISSHLLSDMELICDNLIIVQKGEITYVGPMERTDEETKLIVLLETEDNAAALQWLTKQQFTATLETRYLKIELEEDKRTEIIAGLVEAAIGVKEFKVQEQTLEENFLRWTEEGGL
jgi:ABC-2 type transport system ATP-binding protein